MSNIVEQAKVAVALDGRDAETVLNELTAKTEKYTDALTKAYQAGDKVGMKNALKDLKETEKQLETVKKQTFDVTKVMNNLNGASLKDLKKAHQEISKELEKMTRGTKEYAAKSDDLKKVGTQLSKVKADMSGASDKSGAFGGSLNKISSFATKAFIGVGAFFGAVKSGEAVIKSAQAASDKWEAALGGLKTAMDYVKKSLATLDFKDFIKNVAEAYDVGKQYMQMLDDLGDRNRSLAMQEADSRRYILERMKILRDELSTNEQRVKAADEIIAKEDELAAKRTKNARQAYDAEMKVATFQSKLSQQELENYLKNYDSLSENINKGEQYNALLKERDILLSGSFDIDNSGGMENAAQLRKVQEEIKNTSAETKNWGRIVAGVGKLNDEELNKLVQTYGEVKNAENSALENTQRVASRRSSLLAETARNEKKSLDDQEKLREDAYKKSLEALDNVHDQQLAKEKNRYVQGQITEDQYNRNVFNLEEIYYQARINLLQSYGKDTGEIENQLADLRLSKLKADKEKELALRKKIAEDIANSEKEFDTGIDKENKDVDTEAKDASEGISDEELAKMDARREFMTQYKADSLADEYEMELAHLDSLELAYEDYQAGRIAIGAKYAEKYLSQSQELLGAVSESVSIAKQAELDTVEAEKESELAALEDKFKRGLISEDKYNAQKTSLEQKYKEKEKNISKKYAGTEYTMKIAEIMTSQAMAIANIWSKHAWNPVMAALLTGLAIWNTSNQIASARANYQKAMQAYTGRYDVVGEKDGLLYKNVPYEGEAKTGYYPNRTLISERGGEMIIDNPTLRNIQFNAPDIIPRIMANRVPQYAEGKYPAQSSSQGQENDMLTQTLLVLGGTINNLSAKLDNLYAKVIYDEFAKDKTAYDLMKDDISRR